MIGLDCTIYLFMVSLFLLCYGYCVTFSENSEADMIGAVSLIFIWPVFFLAFITLWLTLFFVVEFTKPQYNQCSELPHAKARGFPHR